jgi:hypothetical protein
MNDPCNKCEEEEAIADWGVCWDCFIETCDKIEEEMKE